MLHAPGVFADLGKLKAEHFWQPAHELIFNTLQQMYADNETPDTITLFGKLSKNQDLLRIGGAPYLSTLLQSFKVAENASYYAGLVIDKWKIREAHNLAHRVLQVTADADDVMPALEAIRQHLDGVDDDQEDTSIGFRDLYAEWLLDQDAQHPAIETPFPILNDRLSGGMQRKRLYVIGARPGCGKTILGAQLALYAAQLHYKSIIFSLELSREDLMGRILACGAHVPYGEITARTQSPTTTAAISRWAAAASALTLQVDDDPEQTIETIAQACRIKKQRDGLDFVFIDYLQLVTASAGMTGSFSRVQAIDHIAVQARNIAKKLDCVVVVAAQLNRNIEGAGGAPRLPVKSDFRESGGIEQTADAALVLSRPPSENGEDDINHEMNLTLVKNRTGTEGTITLQERFNEAAFR